MASKIQSVNVTEPRTLTIRGKEVATSIFKRAVTGAIAFDTEGLVGERRISRSLCDRADHAVSFYPYEHYAHWQRELGVADFSYGYFGENLTSVGLLERDVRLGDVLRLGSLTVQVSQPRLPCVKLDARVGRRFAGRFLRSRRVGFLARVLVPGVVTAGDEIELLERAPRAPTIDDLVRLTQVDAWDSVGLAELLACDQLPIPWQEIVAHKLELARDADGWHGLRPLEVVARQHETEEDLSLWLACPRGRPLAPFVAGQYLTVAWRRTPEESALRRAYAITSDPRALDRYRITVRRVRSVDPAHPAGVVSNALHDLVEIGAALLVAAPRGHATLAAVAAGTRGVLLLSEGIGVATMLPLVRELVHSLPQVPAVHVHLETSRAQLALHGELSSLDSPALRRLIALRAPDRDDRLRETFDLHGEPPPALLRELAKRVDHVFIAGSSAFAEATGAQLAECGATVHVESFG